MTSRIQHLRSVAQRSGGTLYDRLFTLRISVYVTAALLPLRVSPNAVSLVNIFVGVTAWTLIGLNVYPLVGVGLIHVYAVLDSVDGELARATGKSSLKGLFLEDYSAYLMINGYWVAMGGYLAQYFENYWVLLGGFAFAAFGRLTMPAVRRALLKALENTGPPEGSHPLPEAIRPAGQPAGFTAFLLVDLLHPSSVWAVSTTILALELMLDGGRLFLAAVVAAYLALSLAREAGVFVRILATDELDAVLLTTIESVRAPNMSDEENPTTDDRTR